MSASPSVSAGSRRPIWPLLVPAAVAFAYACGHLTWYAGTPLGQVPVLDEQENLAFAEAIVRGALPPEPFYRAPGYALLLATMRGVGVPATGLFHAALLLGVVLHAINATLVAKTTRSLFGDSTAALLAGLCCALHPVFVHYSTQMLDAVPALTFFLLGLSWLVPILVQNEPNVTASPAWRWAGVSVSWAIATMFRPNYFLLWAMLPVLGLWTWRRGGRATAIAAACAGTGIFAAVAGWQWRVSGEAGFLPSQGPYNLWAANQPGAHGRYYVQRHALPATLAAQNPARAESTHLFQQETGRPPQDIHELNAHWRARFIAHVTQHPLAWLGQLARKTYALLNDWEQYNNKTFAFHQARSPWLHWNPLGWGACLLLAIAGGLRLAQRAPRAVAPLALITAACAVSVLLVFVSARFRLPLAALMIVLAGGALAAPRFWRDWPRRHQLVLAAGIVLGAAVTFSSFDGVRDRATFVQDHALLARAADSVGDDALAWQEATAALAWQPMHRDALRLAVVSCFNRLVACDPMAGAEPQWREICARFLALPDADARDLQAVAALALWRSAQPEAALAVWRQLAATPSAMAARALAGDLALAPADASTWPRAAWSEPLVQLAALRFHLPPPPGITLKNAARADEIVRRLFSPPYVSNHP